MSSSREQNQGDADQPRSSYIEHQTTGLSTYQALKQRKLTGNTLFGRRLHVSARFFLNSFTNPPNMYFELMSPSGFASIPTCCEYAHTKDRDNGYHLAVGDMDGRLAFINTDPDDPNLENPGDRLVKIFTCHSSMITDVKWSNDDSKILTSGNENIIKLWDTETDELLATFEGHTGRVNTVNWHSINKNLFISSSDDGSVKVWNAHLRPSRTVDTDNRTIKTITDAHQYELPGGTTTREVWNALFRGRDEWRVITSGAEDGTLKLWNIKRKKGPREITSTIFESPTGQRIRIADSKLDHSGDRLFSACLDNTIYMHYLSDWDKPARQYTDPRLRLNNLDIRISISPDDRFLLSGSQNGDLYIWEINGSRTEAIMHRGHTQISTSVAWCRAQYDQFASCSDDGGICIWSVDHNV